MYKYGPEKCVSRKFPLGAFLLFDFSFNQTAIWMLGTINFEKNHNWEKIIAQVTFICSKSTIEALFYC